MNRSTKQTKTNGGTPLPPFCLRAVSAGMTDVGQRRPHNEDSFARFDELGLYVVADGMGGHAAGEVASRTAISVMIDFIRHELNTGDAAWPSGTDETLDRPEQLLVAAVHVANQCLCNLSHERTEYEGMGTTVAAILLAGEKIYILHVGDSRIYLLRNGELQLMTDDHTWVNEQVRCNLLTLEEARNHRWRNVITRALGNAIDLKVDSFPHTPEPGDIYLLCSDGLTGMLDDDEIEETLIAANGNLTEACESLIRQANEAGGDDNITLLLVNTLAK